MSLLALFMLSQEFVAFIQLWGGNITDSWSLALVVIYKEHKAFSCLSHVQYGVHVDTYVGHLSCGKNKRKYATNPV